MDSQQTSEIENIVVANEYNYFIKNEPEDGHQCYSTQIVSVAANRNVRQCEDCFSKQKEIDRLVAENQNLQKQLNNILSDRGSLADDDNIFEVECLLDHKEMKGKLFFLVRWRGYGPEEDQWVGREDLCCDEILNKYLQLKNLL